MEWQICNVIHSSNCMLYATRMSVTPKCYGYTQRAQTTFFVRSCLHKFYLMYICMSTFTIIYFHMLIYIKRTIAVQNSGIWMYKGMIKIKGSIKDWETVYMYMNKERVLHTNFRKSKYKFKMCTHILCTLTCLQCQRCMWCSILETIH